MLKHFVEAQQLTTDLMWKLFRRASELEKKPVASLKGKILATLFYEPSTRTRLSFESAMLRLGGSVLSTESAAQFSSAVKGESLQDTIRIVGRYADAIVLRHFEDGSAKQAVEVSPVPIINAGDGKGQHPTQALLDVYTIYREFNRLANLRVAMVGDLASGRTVRSLCYLLGKFQGIEVVFISPRHLTMGSDIKDYLTRKGVSWKEESDFAAVLPTLDVIYMTRIQKERMSVQEYEEAKGAYVLNQTNLALVKPDARIMHPLPHVEELNFPLEVEMFDPRIAYFRQAHNGLFVRMALLELLLKGIPRTAPFSKVSSPVRTVQDLSSQ